MARSKNELEEINGMNFMSYQNSLVELGSNGNASAQGHSFASNNIRDIRGSYTPGSKTFNEQMNTRRANSKQSIKSLREMNTSKQSMSPKLIE